MEINIDCLINQGINGNMIDAIGRECYNQVSEAISNNKAINIDHSMEVINNIVIDRLKYNKNNLIFHDMTQVFEVRLGPVERLSSSEANIVVEVEVEGLKYLFNEVTLEVIEGNITKNTVELWEFMINTSFGVLKLNSYKKKII